MRSVLQSAWGRARLRLGAVARAATPRRLTLALCGLVAVETLVLGLDALFPPDLARANRSSPVALDHNGVWLRALPVEAGRWRIRADLARTDPAFLRRGVAAGLLDYIIGQARERGLRRLSLETGRGPAFEPALALYRKRGFADGAAFAGYAPGDFSQFLHLDL